MKLAELFINITAKGADKAAEGLGNIRSTLADITSTSLETKAAIAGILYGLERLTSESNKVGTGLTQFSNLTGLSADRLQRWQYLARQAGEGADEMQASIQGVQNAMTKLVLGHGAPTGIEALKNKVGFDTSKARDTFYVLDKLREYAQKTKDIPDISNEILKSFGLSDKTVQAIRTSRVELDKIDPKRLYSGREISALNNMNIAWSNLGDKVEKSIGHLNVKFGPSVIGDITKLADQTFRLADAFGRLAQNLQLIKGVNKIFGGWTELFKGVADLVDSKTGQANRNSLLQNLQNVARDQFIGAPPVSAQPTVSTSTNHTITVNGVDTNNVAAVKEAVSEAMASAINVAQRQLLQGGGY